MHTLDSDLMPFFFWFSQLAFNYNGRIFIRWIGDLEIYRFYAWQKEHTRRWHAKFERVKWWIILAIVDGIKQKEYTWIAYTTKSIHVDGMQYLGLHFSNFLF